MATLKKTSAINACAKVVFEWHLSPCALTKLIPPWEPVTVEKPPTSLGNGDIAVLLIRNGPFKLRWVAKTTLFRSTNAGRRGIRLTGANLSGTDVWRQKAT